MVFFGKETHYLNKERLCEMIDSMIFQPNNLQYVQNNLLSILNHCPSFDDQHIANSPRAVGDVVQDVIGENMQKCFPTGLIKSFNDQFARRAMADVAFTTMRIIISLLISKRITAQRRLICQISHQ